MEDIYIDIQDQQYQLSEIPGKKEAAHWELPRVLYIEIKAHKVNYVVCPLHLIATARTKQIKTNGKGLIYTLQSILPSVDAVVTDMAPTSLNTMVAFRKRMLQIREAKKVPFILYESELPETIVNRQDFRRYVDDVVPRDIGTGDLKDKIEVLKKLKHTTEVIAQVYPGEVKLIEPATGEYKTLGRWMKRIIDIIAATGLLIVLSPFMLLIALLIKLTSPGPVFYAAKRSGRNYKIFRFIKFRTMHVDADKKLSAMHGLNQYEKEKHKNNNPVFFKIKDDPRITPLGKFLRNTSLDELPQLFNVLKGDMSLVGNRPLPLYEAVNLTTDSCVERFSAPAGITGLWQVKKRGAKEMSVRERIDLDIEYANCCSLRFDLKIMISTPKALLQKDNV